ncbi:MAG: anthranilate synthase component I [Azospirillaceae bacterium]
MTPPPDPTLAPTDASGAGGSTSYVTEGGVAVTRTRRPMAYADAVEPLIDALDARRGVLLSSSYEYPGRYTRWDMGFVDPPLVVTSRGDTVTVEPLNDRGRVLMPAVERTLSGLEAAADFRVEDGVARLTIARPARRFAEEERSRQPSVFSALRALMALFADDGEPHLGLYGAFAYDLAFQFEPMDLALERTADQRDMVLYLPDRLVIVDHQRQDAALYTYEFAVDGRSTEGLGVTGEERAYVPATTVARTGDHAPGDYQAVVERAKQSFARGDLFEVVPGQVFYEPCPSPPSEVFRRLRERNPAPYGFLMTLGGAEYLVGASPEMYVRVTGKRVETCPISGTIARGVDAVSDAEQILALLNSEKDEAELTMCTDVDRNDKSRICVPESVRVIGRRQIEMYSRLIHTVDHVEGRLREGYDALDAFLTHTWAVTVTGAPKIWAMRFIENNERSPRRWYGGAVGKIGFDGNLNTGLTLRTVRVKDGVAEIRVGATLLADSDPDAEDAETRLKASALIDAIRRPRCAAPAAAESAARRTGEGRKVLFVDHQDSFVHTLANYFRRTGAEVVTLRAGFDGAALAEIDPDLVVLSPGPGRPSDFDLARTIGLAADRGLPIYGVCLGLQGMAEVAGAGLDTLDPPWHGKAATVRTTGGRLFEGLPESFKVGRYHSIHVPAESLPSEVEVTATTEDGVVMAIEFTDRPWAAVQFHPESIMTLDDDVGLRIVENAVALLRANVNA